MACPLCPGNSLDPLGSHCVTCKRGGDVTLRHNAICDCQSHPGQGAPALLTAIRLCLRV